MRYVIPQDTGKPKRRLGAVQQALVIHHPAKALLRHAHRFQHGKFSAAQADICGDRIKHIGRGNQEISTIKP